VKKSTALRKRLQGLLEGLKTSGPTAQLAGQMIGMEVRNELTSLKSFQKLKEQYKMNQK